MTRPGSLDAHIQDPSITDITSCSGILIRTLCLRILRSASVLLNIKAARPNSTSALWLDYEAGIRRYGRRMKIIPLAIEGRGSPVQEDLNFFSTILK